MQYNLKHFNLSVTNLPVCFQCLLLLPAAPFIFPYAVHALNAALQSSFVIPELGLVFTSAMH